MISACCSVGAGRLSRPARPAAVYVSVAVIR
jgi:hypothetical protein